MSKVKKNKKEDSEFLIIDKQKFEADEFGAFIMDLDNVENILTDKLPIDRECLICNETSLGQLNSLIKINLQDKMDLTFVRRNNSIVEVTFIEEWDQSSWHFQITMEFYYILKELVLNKEKSYKAQVIQNQVGRNGQVHFEFSIELEASTIGEIYEKAIKNNKSIDDRIVHAIEKGTNCIRSVLEGAFQIDVSNLFSGKDKNTKV